MIAPSLQLWIEEEQVQSVSVRTVPKVRLGCQVFSTAILNAAANHEWQQLGCITLYMICR